MTTVPQPNELTESQRKYIALERQYSERVKPFLKQLDEAKEAVITEAGIPYGSDRTVFFQSEDGCVYAIEQRDYISVQIKPFNVIHTRRAEFGEIKGDLSEKRAKEAGYEVKGL